MRRGTEESPREPCDLGYGRAVAGPSSHTLLKRIGQRVKGRYRLEAVIGTGGQGAVYGATDERDGDRVAIKVLHEEVRQDPAMRERLLREARALMALQGTAALAVLDQGFTEDGYLALVTEFLVGEDAIGAIGQCDKNQREVVRVRPGVGGGSHQAIYH